VSAEDKKRYMKLAHAMQSGVAAEQETQLDDGSPKHMRTGVNSAHVGIAAVVTLLIEKGIFTLDEYEAASADAMQAEVTRYEKSLSSWYGKKVTLK